MKFEENSIIYYYFLRFTCDNGSLLAKQCVRTPVLNMNGLRMLIKLHLMPKAIMTAYMRTKRDELKQHKILLAIQQRITAEIYYRIVSDVPEV